MGRTQNQHPEESPTSDGCEVEDQSDDEHSWSAGRHRGRRRSDVGSRRRSSSGSSDPTRRDGDDESPPSSLPRRRHRSQRHRVGPTNGGVVDVILRPVAVLFEGVNLKTLALCVVLTTLLLKLTTSPSLTLPRPHDEGSPHANMHQFVRDLATTVAKNGVRGATAARESNQGGGRPLIEFGNLVEDVGRKSESDANARGNESAVSTETFQPASVDDPIGNSIEGYDEQVEKQQQQQQWYRDPQQQFPYSQQRVDQQGTIAQQEFVSQQRDNEQQEEKMQRQQQRYYDLQQQLPYSQQRVDQQGIIAHQEFVSQQPRQQQQRQQQQQAGETNQATPLQFHPQQVQQQHTYPIEQYAASVDKFSLPFQQFDLQQQEPQMQQMAYRQPGFFDQAVPKKLGPQQQQGLVVLQPQNQQIALQEHQVARQQQMQQQLHPLPPAPIQVSTGTAETATSNNPPLPNVVIANGNSAV